MGYTIGTNEIITDNREVKLDTVTVTNQSYIEIRKSSPAVIGTNNAFISGVSPTPTQFIQKFPYAIPISDGQSIGALSVANTFGASHTDGTAGFVSGGYQGSPPSQGSTIQKYPFAINGGTATDIGDLTYNGNGLSGFSSETDGYTSGDVGPPTPTYDINKFPFAITSGTATVHTTNPSITHYSGSHSDTANGYISGGGYGSIPAPFDVYTAIKKFPFAAGASVTSIGNLSEKKEQHSHHNSEIDGYAAGGHGPSPHPLVFSIDKFPFSITSGTASSVGTLTPSSASRARASNNSTTAGFMSGLGSPPSGGGGLKVVHSFPFAISSGDASQTSAEIASLSGGGQGADD